MTYKEVQNILQNILDKKNRVNTLGALIRKERKRLEEVSSVKYHSLEEKVR